MVFVVICSFFLTTLCEFPVFGPIYSDSGNISVLFSLLSCCLKSFVLRMNTNQMVLQDQQLLNELFLQNGRFLLYSDLLTYFCLSLRASLCTASSFLYSPLPLVIHIRLVNISGLNSLNKSINIFVTFSIFPKK